MITVDQLAATLKGAGIKFRRRDTTRGRAVYWGAGYSFRVGGDMMFLRLPDGPLFMSKHIKDPKEILDVYYKCEQD